MALDIAAVQAALADDGLDGWLLYDFHGVNPIARSLAGLERRREDDDAALVLPDPAHRSNRAASCTPSSRTRSTHFPGTRSLYAGREALAQGLDQLLEGVRTRGDGILARAARSRISRASMPARSSCPRIAASKSSRRAISCSGSTRCGTRRPWNRTWRPRTRSTGSRIAPSRPSATSAPQARRPREYDIQQLMAGWFREEGLID